MGERKKRGRAWILIPAVVIAIAVIGVVISSFQEEAGIAAPGKQGTAAVAATIAAERALAAGGGPDDYSSFSTALLTAIVAHRSMPLSNPADTRLSNVLARTLDCLEAAREAWQAALDGVWDRETHGRPEYWRALHPFVKIDTAGPLTEESLFAAVSAQASTSLAEAIALVD